MMLIRYLILIIALVASLSQAFGQRLEAKRGVVTDGYDFWFYTPYPSTQVEEEPKPLVIFLHGASLCGRNLEKVRRYGTIDAIDRGRELDAFVIAPQNPGGSWSPHKIMNVVDWVSDNHNIDYDRIYVLGMSLGGYGAIDMAATYPDQIAAAMAFCGGASVKDLSGLSDVPLWIVHGTADRAVTVQQSDKVVDKIKQSGDSSRLIYDRVPGMGHGQPARFFYLPETYEWLFSHSLKDHRRPASESFDITGKARKDAYNDLKRPARPKKTSAKSKKRRSKKR